MSQEQSCAELSETAIAQGADGKGRGEGGKSSCEGEVAAIRLRLRLHRVLMAKGVAKAGKGRVKGELRGIV